MDFCLILTVPFLAVKKFIVKARSEVLLAKKEQHPAKQKVKHAHKRSKWNSVKQPISKTLRSKRLEERLHDFYFGKKGIKGFVRIK